MNTTLYFGRPGHGLMPLVPKHTSGPRSENPMRNRLILSFLQTALLSEAHTALASLSKSKRHKTSNSFSNGFLFTGDIGNTRTRVRFFLALPKKAHNVLFWRTFDYYLSLINKHL